MAAANKCAVSSASRGQDAGDSATLTAVAAAAIRGTEAGGCCGSVGGSGSGITVSATTKSEDGIHSQDDKDHADGKEGPALRLDLIDELRVKVALEGMRYGAHAA